MQGPQVFLRIWLLRQVQPNVVCGSAMLDDVMLLKDGKVVASLTLHDELRPEAASVIAQLERLSCGTSLISGDTTEKCREVAATVGIHDVHAQQLPDQKLELLRSLQNKKAVGGAMMGRYWQTLYAQSDTPGIRNGLRNGCAVNAVIGDDNSQTRSRLGATDQDMFAPGGSGTI